MKRIILFSMLMSILFMSCTFSPSIDDIKDGIIERETANIPLLIQRMDNVSRINIHEFVITQDVEPYAGYMVTTWDIKERSSFFETVPAHTDTILVEVDSITIDGSKYSWRSNWERAYFDVMF